MFSFFKKTTKKELPADVPADFSFLGCDMHSHLVPGIDDGAKSLELSVDFIRSLHDKGYRKLITTPHIHLEFYDNRKDKILRHFAALKKFIQDQRINIELEVAAEYFLDNLFLSGILPEGLLTFSGNHVLVEVSMAGWPRNFSDIIFAIQSDGYNPVLAHPERYLYEVDHKVYQQLKDKGVKMQLNMLSLAGYYGKNVKTLAERFMEHNLYDFCGTDMHHERHQQHIFRMLREEPEIMARLAAYGFKNNTL